MKTPLITCLVGLFLLSARGQAPRYTLVDGSIGVVVLGDYTERDTVKLYNDDGSLWYRFTYYYDDSDGKWDYPNEEFRPRAFHPDYFSLGLDVVADVGTAYVVVVNNDTGVKKRIPKAPFLRFVTWEQYVLGSFAVSFDTASNPIRTAPRAKASVVRHDREDVDHPVLIQGDWLRVRWGREGAWSYGWLRWRNGGRLAVYVHPFA